MAALAHNMLVLIRLLEAIRFLPAFPVFLKLFPRSPSVPPRLEIPAPAVPGAPRSFITDPVLHVGPEIHGQIRTDLHRKYSMVQAVYRLPSRCGSCGSRWALGWHINPCPSPAPGPTAALILPQHYKYRPQIDHPDARNVLKVIPGIGHAVPLSQAPELVLDALWVLYPVLHTVDGDRTPPCCRKGCGSGFPNALSKSLLASSYGRIRS